MTEAAATDEVIRQFLLGDLAEEARERLEAAFISDPETRDRVMMTEDDLIEDYLEGSLGADERDKFLVYYLSAPRQRRKLRIAKSLRGYVAAKAGAHSSPARQATVRTSKLRAYLSKMRPRRRLIFIPLVAALTIAIVAGSIWLFQLQRLNSRLAQENSRRQAIERELVELNTSSRPGPEPAGQTLSLVLAPTSLRSATAGAELAPTTKTSIVELWLVWPETAEYTSYQATLTKVGATGQFAIPNLNIENGPRVRAVRLRIPVGILTHGTYQVALKGVAADGKLKEPVEYTFVVARQDSGAAQ
jgi:type II secretory pathway component PulM